MSYRLEISPNNRATCCNKECKDNGDKCVKGTLRHGTLVTILEHQTWKWRHWGCVTPVQIANMKAKIEDNLEYLDGYEELPEDLQEQVRRAMEQGHVDDEDWNGDLEMNRPGMKGFRSPATKKAAKEQKAEDGESSASPSKPGPKKRGRVKKAEDENASDTQEPPTKKPRAAAKKRQQIKEEGSDSEAVNAEDAPTKKARAPAKGKKTKVEDSGAEAPTAKKAKAPSKREKALKEADNADDASSVEAAPPKKGRGKKKVAGASGNDVPALDGGGDGTPKPYLKARKGRSKAMANEAGDVSSQNNSTAEKPRRGRKP